MRPGGHARAPQYRVPVAVRHILCVSLLCGSAVATRGSSALAGPPQLHLQLSGLLGGDHLPPASALLPNVGCWRMSLCAPAGGRVALPPRIVVAGAWLMPAPDCAVAAADTTTSLRGDASALALAWQSLRYLSCPGGEGGLVNVTLTRCTPPTAAAAAGDDTRDSRWFTVAVERRSSDTLADARVTAPSAAVDAAGTLAGVTPANNSDNTEDSGSDDYDTDTARERGSSACVPPVTIVLSTDRCVDRRVGDRGSFDLKSGAAGAACDAVAALGVELPLGQHVALHSAAISTDGDVAVDGIVAELTLAAERGDIHAGAEASASCRGAARDAGAARSGERAPLHIGPLPLPTVSALLHAAVYRPSRAAWRSSGDAITVTLALFSNTSGRVLQPCPPTQRRVLRVRAAQTEVRPRIEWVAPDARQLESTFGAATTITRLILHGGGNDDDGGLQGTAPSFELAVSTVPGSAIEFAAATVGTLPPAHAAAFGIGGNATDAGAVVALRGPISELQRAVSVLRIRPPRRFVGVLHVNVQLVRSRDPSGAGPSPSPPEALQPLQVVVMPPPPAPPAIHFASVRLGELLFGMEDAATPVPDIVVTAPFENDAAPSTYRVLVSAEHGMLALRDGGDSNDTRINVVDLVGSAAVLTAALKGLVFWPARDWNSVGEAGDLPPPAILIPAVVWGAPLPALARVTVEASFLAAAGPGGGAPQQKLASTVTTVSLDIVVAPAVDAPMLARNDQRRLVTRRGSSTLVSGLRLVHLHDAVSPSAGALMRELCERPHVGGHQDRVNGASQLSRAAVCRQQVERLQEPVYQFVARAQHGFAQLAMETASRHWPLTDLGTGRFMTSAELRSAIDGLRFVPEHNFFGTDTLTLWVASSAAAALSNSAAPLASDSDVAAVLVPVSVEAAPYTPPRVLLAPHLEGRVRLAQDSELPLLPGDLTVDTGSNPAEVVVAIYTRHGSQVRLAGANVTDCRLHHRNGEEERGTLVACLRGSAAAVSWALASPGAALLPAPHLNSRRYGFEEATLVAYSAAGDATSAAPTVTTIVLDVTPTAQQLHLLLPSDPGELGIVALRFPQATPFRVRGIGVVGGGEGDNLAVLSLSVSHGSLVLLPPGAVDEDGDGASLALNRAWREAVTAASASQQPHRTIQVEGTTRALDRALAGLVYRGDECFAADDALMITAATASTRRSAVLTLHVQATDAPLRWRVPAAAASFAVAHNSAAVITGIAIVDECAASDGLYRLRLRADAGSLGVMAAAGVRVDARTEDDLNTAVHGAQALRIGNAGAALVGTLAQLNAVLSPLTYTPLPVSRAGGDDIDAVRLSVELVDNGGAGLRAPQTTTLLVTRSRGTYAPPLLLVPGAQYVEAPCHTSLSGPPATRCGATLSVPRRTVEAGSDLAINDVVIADGAAGVTDAVLRVTASATGGTLRLAATEAVARWVLGRDGGLELSFECAPERCTAALSTLVFRADAALGGGAASAVTILVSDAVSTASTRIPVSVAARLAGRVKWHSASHRADKEQWDRECDEGRALSLDGIFVASADDGDSRVYRVTLRAAHGIAAPPRRLSFVSATDGDVNGREATVLEGTLQDLNSALATLRYEPAHDWSGVDEVSLHVALAGEVAADSDTAGDAALLLIRVAPAARNVTMPPIGPPRASRPPRGLPVQLRLPADAMRDGAPRVFALDEGGWVVLGGTGRAGGKHGSDDEDWDGEMRRACDAAAQEGSAAVTIEALLPAPPGARFIIELGSVRGKGRVGAPKLEGLLAGGALRAFDGAGYAADSVDSDAPGASIAATDDASPIDDGCTAATDSQLRVIGNVDALNEMLSLLTYAGAPRATGADAVRVVLRAADGNIGRCEIITVPVYIASAPEALSSVES